jgi:hypothetical protein
MRRQRTVISHLSWRTMPNISVVVQKKTAAGCFASPTGHKIEVVVVLP